MNNNFQFSIFNFQKHGFTLIETLVAVSIMTIAIAGPLYTASRAIIAAQNSRDQLIASYLAQEGIEYVRMMRDDAYLAVYNQPDASSASWANFLAQGSIGKCVTSAIGNAPFCTLDVAGSGTLAACSGACGKLYLSIVVPRYYTQTPISGVTPQFTRTIQALITTNDAKIVSKVSWSFHNIPYSVTITDHLTPWQ